MARLDTGGGSTGGFVLVVVLWTLGLLSLVVLTLSSVVRLEAKSKANVKQHMQAELLADGIVRLAAADTAAARSLFLRGVPLSSGHAYACALGGGAVVVTLTDAAGLIDLNAAPWRMLVQMLRRTGLKSGRAGALARAIVDFRDIDDKANQQRSERQTYLEAGMAHGPKNSPFESVSELDQVLGMTPQILASIKPLVTVHSHIRDVELDVASDAVIAALTDDDPFTARAKARAARLAEDDTRSAEQARALTLYTFDMRVLAMLPAGSSAVRHAVFDLDAGNPLGFSIREWESSLPTVAEVSLASEGERPPCFEEAR